MTLSPTFQFSQNSLQDYAECPRRFQLRYLLRQPWPAVESEPLGEYERLVDLARRFHRLIEQHNLSVPESDLESSIGSAELRRWWRNYLEAPPPDLPSGRRHPELVMSAPVGNHRLVAKYDLLALDPGRRAVLVDWKTNSTRPDSAALASRLQTRVYRFVLVEAGAALNGGVRIAPEQVTMVYWFAEHPAEAETLPYSASLHLDDANYLRDLSTRIVTRARDHVDSEWPLTEKTAFCRFCTYRSLCDRGVLPGPLAEYDTDKALDLDVDFDFEGIDEIEY